uniref:Uncharacterized protein n=1 Tax=Mucochytrium quahogii TaxID=96639 RepID=A0A7S2WDD8_9STRA|mmetsp:Transcript_20923/g.45731  ORF Transcript_20923/g.45731 Transcript_20923/m.45731 type:complete len:335 (+) Transcript_20923:129-1133(+)
MKLAILMVLATSCCLQTALGLSQNGDVDIASETNELWRPVAFRDKRELFEGDLVLDLDEGHLKELLEEEAGRAKIPLVLPSGRIVSFKVRKSDIMPPKLAEKYPEILAFEGQSVDEHPPMQVTLQLSPTKRFRAFIQGAAGDFLIDPKKGDETHYVSQPFTREHRATHAEVAKHHCKTMNITADEHASGRRLVGSDTHAVEYTFVIGMVANGEYSTYHGGTKASVLAEIVTLMSRVNGIFKRELGTFFQLHEEVDRLICLEPCMIPNTAAVLDEVGGVNDFLESISFSLDKADIFHTLTTGAGGVACLGSLCHSTYKSCGVTGLDNPTADAYYV